MATAPRRVGRTRVPATPVRARTLQSSTGPAVQIVPLVPQPARDLVVEYIDITDLTPYEWNPRDNADAIPHVMESLKQFGWRIPCVIDNDNVVVAGHTRIEAAKALGWLEVPCTRVGNLTPEQVNAFRVIDNKVAESAKWNFDLLAGEIGKLNDLGLDFTAFGWQQQEIDCMSQLVAADCLSTTDLVPESAREAGAAPRRGPMTTRFVIGEIVFFIPTATYNTWVDGLRHLHQFDKANIESDLKQRLGILE